MYRFSKLVTTMLVALLIATLFSCSDLMGDVSSQGQTREAYVTLKLGNTSSRTILPVTDSNNFTDIVLMGAPSGESPRELGSWARVAEMQNVTIPVSPNYWTFTLMAKNGGIPFSGSTEKQIVAGGNALSFVLMISDCGTGSGSFSVTLDFFGAQNSSKVSYVEAILEDFYNNVTVISERISPSADMVTFAASGVVAGTYRVRVTFYTSENGTDEVLATYREIVQVVTDLESTATRTIQSLEGEISSESAGITAKITFDFSGAKAVAQLEASASSSRAAATADSLEDLVKILSDGSMQSVVTVGDDVTLSKMSAVYKSPVSEDVFVVFEDFSQLGWDGTEKPTTIGSLICVHADGTVADILKVRDSWNLYTNYMRNPTQITFDALGNLYFIACDYYDSNGNYINNAGQVIYKFEPSSDTLTTMVAEVDGTRYEKLQITNDGAWILVQGTRNNFSTYFLRAIPASNPNNFVNIFYSSTNSIQSDKWIYDDNSGLLCYVATDGQNTGLHTVSKNGGFKDKQFRSCNIGGRPYDWFKDFCNDNIDANTFFTKFSNACPWDIEFRYYAWDESNQTTLFKGIEALEKIKELEGDSILSYMESSDTAYYPWHLLYYCYLKDTNTRLTEGFVYKNGYNQYFYYDFLAYDGNYATAFSVRSTGIYAEFWPNTTNTLCLVTWRMHKETS